MFFDLGLLKLVAPGLLFVFFVYLVYRNNPPKGIVFVCLFFLFYLLAQYWEEVDKVFSASSNLHTFDAIVEDIQWPVAISLVVVDGKRYGVVRVSPRKTNALAVFLFLTSFRSGMPAYVFNTHGILIDSTLDHHDDRRYKKRWGTLDKAQQITKGDFLALIRDNALVLGSNQVN